MDSILDLLLRFISSTWVLTAEMAPYLILGFVLAGLLRSVFTENWVRRHLGQRGFRQVIKAVLIGIPLPLCSCGVIPVAAGIRRQGGQRGAVAAFTASTPQTGVDSIAATVGMMGWVFACVRIVIAFINGIVAGLVVERWGEQDSEDDEPELKVLSGLKFGLLTLPKDLFGALVLGLLVAGAISAMAPENFFASIPGGTFTVYVAMTLISLPLYVCSTGSIPLAFSFLQAGMSPGAVLIFLIAGPASNAATVTSLWQIIGGRSTIGYILSIVATCWLMAFAIDFTGISLLVTETLHHHHSGLNWFQHSMGGLLVAMLAFAKLR
jgi:uncharacterized membrane protein YraQ (UPF0718 family)